MQSVNIGISRPPNGAYKGMYALYGSHFAQRGATMTIVSSTEDWGIWYNEVQRKRDRVRIFCALAPEDMNVVSLRFRTKAARGGEMEPELTGSGDGYRQGSTEATATWRTSCSRSSARSWMVRTLPEKEPGWRTSADTIHRGEALQRV